jgi:N-terminal domain of argonaute
MCLQRLPDVAHHYDVEFDPERMPKRFLPEAFKKFQEQYYPNRPFAFDGRRNGYFTERLEEKSGEVRFFCPDTGKEKSITVTIKWAAEVDFRPLKGLYAGTMAGDVPQAALQCLNAVLRSAHDRTGIVAVSIYFE